tara:strand:- start:218 stop:505 length:288 start_codon:yes stop_codon:yes gene_type:complete
MYWAVGAVRYYPRANRWPGPTVVIGSEAFAADASLPTETAYVKGVYAIEYWGNCYFWFREQYELGEEVTEDSAWKAWWRVYDQAWMIIEFFVSIG